MDPKRVLIVDSVTLNNGVTLPLWAYVWQLEPARDGRISIEYRNQVYPIPIKCAVETPVAPPSKKQLSSLDLCFSDIPKGLEEVYDDTKNYFSVFRCPHDNYFLKDLRGGIAMFHVWLFLGVVTDQSAAGWESHWRKFHNLPMDAIHYLGVGC